MLTALQACMGCMHKACSYPGCIRRPGYLAAGWSSASVHTAVLRCSLMELECEPRWRCMCGDGLSIPPSNGLLRCLDGIRKLLSPFRPAHKTHYIYKIYDSHLRC